MRILDRVTWLRNQGCVFATNVEAKLRKLRKMAPQWVPAEAAGAADSREMRGGFVKTDTSFHDLANVPISELITRAIQGQKRVWSESQEYDPFAGLCEKHPVRMLANMNRRGHSILRYGGIEVSGAKEGYRSAVGAPLHGRRISASIS